VKYTKAIVRGADEATKARYPRGLDVPISMLLPADGSAPEPDPVDVEAQAAKRLAELEHAMQFTIGTLVQIKKPFAHYTVEDVFVVTGNNEKTLSLAKLGGEGGKYLRVPHRGASIVSVAGLHLDADGHLIP
jgi:hypothetical protein